MDEEKQSLPAPEKKTSESVDVAGSKEEKAKDKIVLSSRQSEPALPAVAPVGDAAKEQEDDDSSEKAEEKDSTAVSEVDEYSAESLLKSSSKKEVVDEKKEEEEVAAEPEEKPDSTIFALRTTANREDQVMDFLSSNISRKALAVYSVIRPHGMRGYVFIEADSRADAEAAAQGIPYARGILPKEVDYSEMEHMVEPVKRELTIKKNDIVEIISGPFKRETAKITRIDEQKEEVVVELVEAAVPIPITLKIDAVKVIRRDSDSGEE